MKNIQNNNKTKKSGVPKKESDPIKREKRKANGVIKLPKSNSKHKKKNTNKTVDSSDEDGRNFYDMMDYLKEFAGKEQSFNMTGNREKPISKRSGDDIALKHHLVDLDSSSSSSDSIDISQIAPLTDKRDYSNLRSGNKSSSAKTKRENKVVKHPTSKCRESTSTYEVITKTPNKKGKELVTTVNNEVRGKKSQSHISQYFPKLYDDSENQKGCVKVDLSVDVEMSDPAPTLYKQDNLYEEKKNNDTNSFEVETGKIKSKSVRKHVKKEKTNVGDSNSALLLENKCKKKHASKKNAVCGKSTNSENNLSSKNNISTNSLVKKDISLYVEKILHGRYNTTEIIGLKSSDPIENSDNSSTVKYGLSNFETEKEDSDVEDTRAKMLEIISHADDELLNILDENEQLRQLEIDISWDVPLSHTIETRISSCPTKEQQQLFKDLNINIKNGPFSRIEDESIKENFKQFCTKHALNYDPVPFLNLHYGNRSLLQGRQRINFARYIGRGLTNRKLHHIYNRYKVLYSTFNKGRFLPEEDAVILEYTKLRNDRNQFSSLSKILKRPRPLIEKRYRILQRQSKTLQPENFNDFVKCLLSITNSSSLEDLKHKYITNDQWAEVSKTLNVCKTQLKIYWKASLWTKLFYKGPIPTDDIMRKLIRRLYESNEDDYRKLNWSDLAELFEDITRPFLYRLFQKTLRSKVPESLRGNLRTSVIYLKHLYVENESVMPDITNISISM